MVEDSSSFVYFVQVWPRCGSHWVWLCGLEQWFCSNLVHFQSQMVLIHPELLRIISSSCGFQTHLAYLHFSLRAIYSLTAAEKRRGWFLFLCVLLLCRINHLEHKGIWLQSGWGQNRKELLFGTQASWFSSDAPFKRFSHVLQVHMPQLQNIKNWKYQRRGTCAAADGTVCMKQKNNTVLVPFTTEGKEHISWVLNILISEFNNMSGE